MDSEEFNKIIDKFSKSFDSLKTDIAELKAKKFCDEHLTTMTKMDTFIGKVTEWMSTTTEYRKNLCAKIDDIRGEMSKLPCPERKGWYQSMGRQVTLIWGVFALTILIAVFDIFIRK